MIARKMICLVFSLTLVLAFTFSPISVHAEEVGVPVTAEITAPKELHNVLVTIEGQGNVYLNKNKAYKDEKITLTAIPTEGWKFSKWKISSLEEVTISDLGNKDDDRSGAFLMPDKDVAITVVFEEIPILFEPTSPPTPVPTEEPEEEIIIYPPKVEPKEDTFFDRIEELIPAIVTVTGSSFVAGATVWLLLLFRRKKVFKGIFSEINIPGTKVKGNADVEDFSEWFIPYMIEEIADGQMTIAEYIDTLNDAPVSTVFPSDTTMEVAYGKTTHKFKAKQKEMFKILSTVTGEVTFRFVSESKGMDFSITYDII